MEVCRNGENTLDTRTVPVIFVPGVMGTRLEFPSIGQSWNPDSIWDMVHWVTASAEQERRELHWSQPANIIATNDDLTAPEIRRGWAGVVTKFYVPFLRALAGVTFSCARIVVYVSGYDWRQSNRDSGNWLAGEITRILNIEQADRCVIVTHSMGGIVTRSCLHEHAATADKVLGVVHVVQPARGAAVFYRRMYTGAISDLDGGGPLARIQGTTPEEFATVLSALRGPCELIPNNDYRDTGPTDWLVDERARPPRAWTGDMFAHYVEPTGPPGVWWSLAPPPSSMPGVIPVALPWPAVELKKRMNDARAFHARLDGYKHPRTWAIYSTGLDTDMAVHFTTTAPAEHRGAELVRRPQGDGTVPSTSARSLFSDAETSMDTTGMDFIRDRSKKQGQVSGVEHAEAFNSGEVRTVLEKMLQVILGCVPPPSPAGDYEPARGAARPA